MPPVLIAVAGAVYSALAAVGVEAGVAATIANFVVSTQVVIGGILAAGNWAIGKISAAIRGNPLIDHGRQVSVRQSDAPRRIVIGRARVSGVVTFAGLYSPTTNDILQFVYTLTGHQVEQIVKTYFDDVEVPITGSPSADSTGGQYGGFAWLEYKDGHAGEAAFPILSSSPYNMGKWSSAHRQDGCASVKVGLYWNGDKYPNGVPNISWDIKGKLLYDPRSSTTAYSENPALAIRWYLTDKEFGLGADDAEIDDASVIAAANVCDEAVTLDAGGTEPRYTCNGVFDSDAEPGSVLEALANSMSGSVIYTGGKWILLAGAYNSPSLHLTDSDLMGPIQVQTLKSKRDMANAVRGTFFDPTAKWQKTDFPPVIDADAVAEDSGYPNTTLRGQWVTATAYSLNDNTTNHGRVWVCISAHTSGSTTQPGVGASWATVWVEATEIAWMDIDYPFTISSATCQRLSTITINKVRRQTTATLHCKMAAWQLQAGDVFYFTHSRFGWTDKTFLVLQSDLVLKLENDAPVLGVDLQIQETDANVYGWSHGELLPPRPSPPTFPTLPTPKPALGDGSIGKTGSVPPTMAEGFTYASTTTSITWSWDYSGTHKIIRTDAALTQVEPLNSVSSQAITGLTANRNYGFYPFYDEINKVIDFVTTGGVGSPTWAHQASVPPAVPAGDRNWTAEQTREDHLPLSTGIMLAATTVSGSGGGGGGGGGGCLALGMKVREKRKGVIDVIEVDVGDELWTQQGFKRVTAKREQVHDKWIECEFNNGARLIVTSGHPFTLENGNAKRASELCLEDAIPTPTGVAFATSLKYSQESRLKVPISIEYPHTFYASGDGEHWVLTHNGPYNTN